MGATRTEISPELAEWIARQRLFFVATAALSTDGTVNLSPKGYDTLRVIDPTTLAYLDLTGSGAETIAHLRENGRITVMWCSFEGAPRIVRVHGRGEVRELDDPLVAGLFAPDRAARAVLRITIERVSDSCGYAVPEMTFVGERTRLHEWAEARTDEEIIDYRRRKNSTSIDGLPGLDH